MKTEELIIMRDPANPGFYLATCSVDEDNDAQGLDYQGGLSGAIEEALRVWGLSEEGVNVLQLIVEK